MIEFRLLDNSVESLKEALKCWKEAEQGKHERYRFAILHFCHYIELALKHAVCMQHPLLVYKQPSQKSLVDAQTITPQDAFHILRNSEESHGDVEFSFEEIEPFNRLKKIRNKIEHYVYEPKREEFIEDLKKFLATVDSICNDRADSIPSEYLDDDDLIALYCDLCDSD